MPFIVNCVIVENSTDCVGGAIYCEGCGPAIFDCLIARNSAHDPGGGIYGRAFVRGCTIVENSVVYDGGGGVSGCSYSAPSVDVAGCILWANTPNQARLANIRFSDVQGGWPGLGNFDLDPLFVAAGAGDYHLQPASPCIDTGVPLARPLPGARDLDGTRRIWDGDGDGVARMDMGVDEYGACGYGDVDADGDVDLDDYYVFRTAFGHCQGAPEYNPLTDLDFDYCTTLADYRLWRRYYLEAGADPQSVPGSGPGVAGDLNCDGAVDFADINPFVLYLTDLAGWQATYPGCPPVNGDINSDGLYPSFTDISAFTVLLSGRR